MNRDLTSICALALAAVPVLAEQRLQANGALDGAMEAMDREIRARDAATPRRFNLTPAVDAVAGEPPLVVRDNNGALIGPVKSVFDNGGFLKYEIAPNEWMLMSFVRLSTTTTDSVRPTADGTIWFPTAGCTGSTWYIRPSTSLLQPLRRYVVVASAAPSTAFSVFASDVDPVLQSVQLLSSVSRGLCTARNTTDMVAQATLVFSLTARHAEPWHFTQQ